MLCQKMFIVQKKLSQLLCGIILSHLVTITSGPAVLFMLTIFKLFLFLKKMWGWGGGGGSAFGSILKDDPALR